MVFDGELFSEFLLLLEMRRFAVIPSFLLEIGETGTVQNGFEEICGSFNKKLELIPEENTVPAAHFSVQLRAHVIFPQLIVNRK